MNIKKSIANIRRDAPSMTPESLRIKYAAFVDQYPRLYDAVLNPGFDMKYLDMMLEFKGKLEGGELTELEADEKVYGILKKEYVNPLFPEEKGEAGEASASQ
jgi:hypothetical protein